jgi:hypothetical protein
MGVAASIPDTIDEATARELAGDYFDSAVFAAKAKNGVVTKKEFISASLVKDLFEWGEDAVLFKGRSSTSHEVCTVGRLAAQSYGHARGKLPMRVPLNHLYNIIGMLRFAQISRNHFNMYKPQTQSQRVPSPSSMSSFSSSPSSSSQSASSSDYARYMRQDFLEIMSR